MELLQCNLSAIDFINVEQLSCSQGFRLPGTNRMELLQWEVLLLLWFNQALVALVQANFDLVQALVALVQALDALVQAHHPQRGLKWVVKRQVVVGPGSGLAGAVLTWGEGGTGLFLTGQVG